MVYCLHPAARSDREDSGDGRGAVVSRSATDRLWQFHTDHASGIVAVGECGFSPTPVASDDVCGLLSPDEINEVLGTQFPAGEQTSDDARQIVTCTYTMVDSSTGVDLPLAIVNVGCH